MLDTKAGQSIQKVYKIVRTSRYITVHTQTGRTLVSRADRHYPDARASSGYLQHAMSTSVGDQI